MSFETVSIRNQTKRLRRDFIRKQTFVFQVEIFLGLKRCKVITDLYERPYFLVQNINPWHPLTWIVLPVSLLLFSFLYGVGAAISELKESIRFQKV